MIIVKIVHGRGLTHLMFLPETAGVLEFRSVPTSVKNHSNGTNSGQGAAAPPLLLT